MSSFDYMRLGSVVVVVVVVVAWPSEVAAAKRETEALRQRLSALEKEKEDAQVSKARSSVEVAAALKRKLYERGFKRIVRANKCQCLDQCSQGPVVVVYPEGVWYGKVTLEDVDEIIEQHIVGGKVVTRLVIPDDQLTGIVPGECPS